MESSIISRLYPLRFLAVAMQPAIDRPVRAQMSSVHLLRGLVFAPVLVPATIPCSMWMQMLFALTM